MKGKTGPDPAPPGYKRTEVGVIPEDWEIKHLGEIGRGIIGLTYSPRDVSHDGILVLRASNIGDNSLVFDDNVLVKTDVPDELLVQKNDLLICVRNGSRNLIGKCALIDADDSRMTFGAFMTVFRSKSNPFVFYCFQSEIIKRQIQAHLGATINQITNRSLNSFIIPFPPLPEQRAIARALADADAWIQALERLIAKQRALKQAAMGDLLSGRVRLPGFIRKPGYKPTEIGPIPEDWEVQTFAELFEFLATSSRSRSDLDDAGDVFYIHYGDIHTKWHFVLDFAKHHVPKIENVKVRNASLLRDGDLIMVDASEDEEGVGKAVEIKNLGTAKAVAGLHTLALRPKGNSFALGFSAYIQAMKAVQQQIRRIATGLKVFGISKTNLSEVLVPIPPYPEQHAIARVLSDMDAAIDALERERAKAAAIKQGMMQELLTGRIRLVKSQQASLRIRPTMSKQKKRSEEFHEAVLISVVTKHFSDYKHPIGRFRRTKLVYLLRRHLQVGVQGYLKKAAGPYRPKTKYGGAEQIALTKGYVKRHQADRFEGFISGPHADKAESYFLRWYGSEPIQWLNRFKYRKNEELELLTTVDMAIKELQEGGQPVNVTTVKSFIYEEPEWLPKLDREIFSDFHIARAMRELRHLFDGRRR